MEYVVARFDDELYHYGVKGMKWGVRRYMKPDGSLTPQGKRKVSNYKAKEMNTLKKRYTKLSTKDQYKLEKTKTDYQYAVSRYGKDSKQAVDKASKYLSASFDKHMNDKEFRAQMNKVRQMSLSDISKEKRAVGATVATITLMNAGFVGAGVLTKVPVPPIIPLLPSNIRDAKYNTRVKLDDRYKLMDEAMYESYDDYERLTRN